MNPPQDEHTPLRSRKPRGCSGIFFAFVVILAAVWGGMLGLFVSLLDDVQAKIVVLEDFRPKVGSKIYADPATGGELLGEYTIDYRQLVSLSEIPLRLQKAFMAGEDHIFYEHRGVRPDAIVNSMLYYLKTKSLRGASTITMQLVRNLEPTGIGREREMRRKLREMLFALQIERQYTKDEILELYLNQIHLGGGAYGVEAAARQYFGVHCEDLTLGEAALLVGMAPAPKHYRPDRFPKKAIEGRDRVLKQMLEKSFINLVEYDAAVSEDTISFVITPERQLAMMAEGRGFWGPNKFIAPYFVEEVRRAIQDSEKVVSKKELTEGGLEIYTTLDLELQKAAEQAVIKAQDEFDAKVLARLKRDGREKDFVPVATALVCLDNRPGCEGYVRALVGGRDWETQKYNTVTQARRQPGSSIKPYVWAGALGAGFTPSTQVSDGPFQLGKWSPKNFDGSYKGMVTLRYALTWSRNMVSIRLAEKVGVARVKALMKNAGVESEITVNNLTIALGTPNITVMDQAAAYSTFAKNGTHARPMLWKEIRNADGFVRNTNDIRLKREAIRPDIAYVMTNLMQAVCTEGTGARSKALDRPRAGKTGTTNESRDVWFCGYTPDYTCVVWVGYRDNRPLGGGADFTGGRLACPIWTDFMVEAHKNLPVRDFDVPSDVQFINVEKGSGVAGGGFKEAFPKDAQPPKAQPVYQAPEEMEELMSKDLADSLDSSFGPDEDSAASPAPIDPSPATPSPLSPPLPLEAPPSEARVADAMTDLYEAL